MSNQIPPDPVDESLRSKLQNLFNTHGNVAPIQLSNPALIEEFRPGATHDTDMGHLPKPSLDWAYGVECGIICGEGRLAAIVFSHYSRLHAFMEKNPALMGALVTAWSGAIVIWLRVSGCIPQNFRVDGVRWCSSGTVLIGCPELIGQKVLQRGEIKLVDFSQLAWTKVQQDVIDRLLVEAEVGPPLKILERGRRRLNTAFWAKWFMRKFSFTYDADKRAFGWDDRSIGIPEWHSEDDSLRILGELLQFSAKSSPGEFPDGELRPTRVRQILERIKLLATQARSSDELLDRFLETHLVRSPGEGITSFEIRARYVTYCHELGRTPCPKARFLRVIKSKLRNMGVDQRHDIERAGKSARGYGVQFKSDPAPKITDGSDAADGTDGAPNPLPS